MKEAVLELNASNDRGIDIVRNKIKMFAQQKVTLPPGRHKVVILDEADRYVLYKKKIIVENICSYVNLSFFVYNFLVLINKN
jgi:hypothetical protein